VLAWVATVDAFQHWLYTHPQHTHAERDAEWVRTHQRFGSETDWRGHERYLETLWHRQLHIFEVPFYYVEYGIAQLGALQVWRQMRLDRAAATAAYQRGLAAGGSLPLPQIYAAAGIKFDFSRETVAPLMELVASELGL
jgi:oligoendopeptidase F